MSQLFIDVDNDGDDSDDDNDGDDDDDDVDVDIGDDAVAAAFFVIDSAVECKSFSSLPAQQGCVPAPAALARFC